MYPLNSVNDEVINKHHRGCGALLAYIAYAYSCPLFSAAILTRKSWPFLMCGQGSMVHYRPVYARLQVYRPIRFVPLPPCLTPRHRQTDRQTDRQHFEFWPAYIYIDMNSRWLGACAVKWHLCGITVDTRYRPIRGALKGGAYQPTWSRRWAN